MIKVEGSSLFWCNSCNRKDGVKVVMISSNDDANWNHIALCNDCLSLLKEML